MAGSCISDIFFQSDGLRLRGVLHQPDRLTSPFVVGSHGLFSDGDSPKQVRLAEALSEKGIAFFRFDHRGCGMSEGDFPRVTSLQDRAEDIIHAIRIASTQKGAGPFLGLFGSSLGGAASLSVASKFPVPAVVTVAAPVRSRQINAAGREAELDPLTVALLKQKIEFDLSGQMPRIRNILIFHGDADETVPFSNAREIREKAGDPKRLIRFEGGDHRIGDPGHQAVFIQESVRWFLQAAESL